MNTTKKENYMKPPFKYYGGKQLIADWIINYIPEHKLYVEPFCGGAAVFWAKGKSKNEVLNDTSDNLMNLYKVLKTEYTSFEQLVLNSLHSRKEFYKAKATLDAGTGGPVVRAYAYWYVANFSYGATQNGFATDKEGGTQRGFYAIKKRIANDKISQRLETVTLEHLDALEIIQKYDCAVAFFYVDPPYVGTDQGFYAGYSQDDFNKLLSVLYNSRGKFLLSHYKSDFLTEVVRFNQWAAVAKKTKVQFLSNLAGEKHREEILIANYPLIQQKELF